MYTLARIRLLIAEPLPLWRHALASLCSHQGGFSVAGVCADGLTAQRMMAELRPDVSLLDIDLPALHTLELLRQLPARDSRPKTVLMSIRSDRRTVLEGLRCGAQGFVLKNGTPEELFESLRQVREGGVYVTPRLQLEAIFSPGRGKRTLEDPIDSLSAREHQVFTMLVDGLRAKEIAARLSVSPKTIDTYRASMMRKLDIHDVAGLVKFAIHQKLTPWPGDGLRLRAAGGG